MNNPKIKYLLIVLVSIVWGIIIFRVFNLFKTPSESYNPNLKVNATTQKENNLDTFSIKANYPDPFLRNTYIFKDTTNDEANSSALKKTVLSQPKPEIKIVWPNIIFKGTVSNLKGDIVSILIVINGSNYILKKGDIVNDIEIQTITTDSVMMKYRDDVKFIKRYESK